MGLFGLVNYEDLILKAIINSGFARNGLIIVVTYIITSIVKLHISALISTIFNGTMILDLVLPIIVGIALSIAADSIFRYVQTHQATYEVWVDYFIANYSRANFVRWKRMCLLIICGYIFLLLAFITIDNYFIFVSTVQTAIISIISDSLEQGLLQRWMNDLSNWLHRPRITRTKENNMVIHDNYDPPLTTGKTRKRIISDHNRSPPSTPVISVQSRLQVLPELLLTPSIKEQRLKTRSISNLDIRGSLDKVPDQKSLKYVPKEEIIPTKEVITELSIDEDYTNSIDESQRVSPIQPKPVTPPQLYSENLSMYSANTKQYSATPLQIYSGFNNYRDQN